MTKFFTFLLLLITCYFLLITDCRASDRNIFGLHLTQLTDISKAKNIINSGLGDWGWATIVIRLDLMDHNAWQQFFDNCRTNHIIPIVRIGTVMDQGNWRRPTTSEIDQLTSFLNSLNWPTQKQHVILFNEINHASEWGGEVDIRNYTDMAIYASQKLKSYNPDFVVMGSALDLAAPDKDKQFASASSVYKEIFSYNPQYFDFMDALASHSYPNHGFVASPQKTGQQSIRGYSWELDYLKKLGINKEYKVYITETGWPHRLGEKNDNRYFTTKTSVNYLKTALDIWQNDNRVMAVTPFIYNYPYEPFDHFSWVDKKENLLPEYQEIVALPKLTNHPEQKNSYEITQIRIPFLMFHDTEYEGTVYLKNTGQAIWGETNFCISSASSDNITTSEICTTSELTPPKSIQKINFKFSFTQTDKDTYLQWGSSLPQLIEPTILSGNIYRPKTGIKERINQFIKDMLFQYSL